MCSIRIYFEIHFFGISKPVFFGCFRIIAKNGKDDILVTEPAPAPVRASRAKVEADSSAPVDTSDAAIDALLAQITALEKQHENGQINHDLYHQKRKQLKAALAALMGTDETD